MRPARALGGLCLLCYIMAESLLVKDNQLALRSAEEGIDRLTKGKLAEKSPDTYISLLSILNMIGVFALVASYLKKYYTLLVVYLFLTRWRVFFGMMRPYHPDFYDSRLPGNKYEYLDEAVDPHIAANRVDPDWADRFYDLLPPPFFVTTFCLSMVFVKEALDSWLPEKVYGRTYDARLLQKFIYDVSGIEAVGFGT